jgi:hypothetical protein
MINEQVPDQAIRDYANKLIKKELAETEYLIAAFIAAHPDVPIDQIELVRKIVPLLTGGYETIFSVRKKNE